MPTKKTSSKKTAPVTAAELAELGDVATYAEHPFVIEAIEADTAGHPFKTKQNGIHCTTCGFDATVHAE